MKTMHHSHRGAVLSMSGKLFPVIQDQPRPSANAA
jgi:hypothetical protein